MPRSRLSFGTEYLLRASGQVVATSEPICWFFGEACLLSKVEYFVASK